MLSIPLKDVIAYRKLSKAFYALIDVLCVHHIAVITTCESSSFRFIMTALESGLKALDVTISSQCAAALNWLAAYYFRHVVASVDVNSPPAAAQALAEHIAQNPEMFPSLLKTLLEIVLLVSVQAQVHMKRSQISRINHWTMLQCALANAMQMTFQT